MDEGWAPDHREQTAHLQAQLNAIDTLPVRRRRGYQLLVLRCQGCGDVLLEVLDTRPYAVVRMRPPLDDFRRGGWRWSAIPWPTSRVETDPDSDRVMIPAVCRCQRVDFLMRSVLDDLRAGRRNRIVRRS